MIHEKNVNAGLVARFGLAAYPKEIDRIPVDRKYDGEAKDDWENLLRTLRSAFGGNSDEKIVFKFASDAQPLFTDWRREHLRELKNTTEPFRAHVAKYQGLLARISLCFHLATIELRKSGATTVNYDGTEISSWDTPTEPISKTTLQSAITFLDNFLKPHAQRLYAVVDYSPGQAMGRRIASEIFLVDSSLKSITVSEILRKSRTGMKAEHDVSIGLRYLDFQGWGSFNEHDQSKSKKPAKRFTVSPRIHETDWDTSE